MKIDKYFLSIIFLVHFFSACKKNDNPNSTIIAATSIADVAYGTADLQKMDVYLPSNRSTVNTKVIVLIHGGGWTNGDKKEIALFVDSIKMRLPDYAIFNINYRLNKDKMTIFPTQENDVKAALQFIFSKAPAYLISDKYVLIGASAGAHLAMLQGYKYDSPVRPKAIVSFFGPGDLIDLVNKPVGGNIFLSLVFANAIGKTPEQDPALYASSSPVNYIKNISPPTILFHGAADPFISPSQSENIKNKLTAAGVVNQYILYPGKGHGDDWGNKIYTDAFNKLQAFLSANVQ